MDDEEKYDEWKANLVKEIKEEIRADFRKDAGNWLLRHVLYATGRVALIIVVWEIGGKRAIEWFKLLAF